MSITKNLYLKMVNQLESPCRFSYATFDAEGNRLDKKFAAPCFGGMIVGKRGNPIQSTPTYLLFAAEDFSRPNVELCNQILNNSFIADAFAFKDCQTMVENEGWTVLDCSQPSDYMIASGILFRAVMFSGKSLPKEELKFNLRLSLVYGENSLRPGGDFNPFLCFLKDAKNYYVPTNFVATLNGDKGDSAPFSESRCYNNQKFFNHFVPKGTTSPMKVVQLRDADAILKVINKEIN